MDEPTNSTPATLPRILCVDDEAAVLSGLRDNLRCDYDVTTAMSGDEALAHIQKGPPFVVILSDMRMPGMNGAAFLARAKQQTPDTVRLLLTGVADFKTAVAAVNEGNVFRFLTKPCPKPQLKEALRQATEQYRMVTGDRQLMQEKLDSMAAQLIHAERLATLGTLAGGVGHELGNVTTVFVSIMPRLKRCAEQGQPPSTGDLAHLARVEQHLRLHCRHLTELGRPTSGRASRQDLLVIVTETIAMLEVAGRLKHIPTSVKRPEGDMPIEVDRTHIEQVLVNLLGNAADAIREAKCMAPRIDVRISQDYSNHSAVCEIEDNGCGMAADRLETIFEPYFTTKAPGKGTGLGLVVVKQIVESYGGTLSVRSDEGKGTCFSFSLPLA